MAEKFLRPKDVAQRLGVDPKTVKNYIQQGLFPGAFTTEGGHWRIPESSVIAYLEKRLKK